MHKTNFGGRTRGTCPNDFGGNAGSIYNGMNRWSRNIGYSVVGSHNRTIKVYGACYGRRTGTHINNLGRHTTYCYRLWNSSIHCNVGNSGRGVGTADYCAP